MTSPSRRSLLFNPGPTNVSDVVRDALRTPDICHREPEFTEVLLRVNRTIVRLLGGEGTHSAVLFVSSGTGCNEAIISSMHGKVLVVNNGKYSDRLCEIIERYQIPYTRLRCDPFTSVDPTLVGDALRVDPAITHVAVVHHETTTGALTPLHEIGELTTQYGKLLIVDAVSSLGGHPIDLERDHIDFCAVSANKCLESFPGVSFVIGRTAAIPALKGKSRSFYFDLHAQWEKEQRGETPFTPAVQLIFALDAALQRFEHEGSLARVERYRRLADRMRRGLRSLGFELVLLPNHMQSNILTTIRMPEGMDYWVVHDKLKERGITLYSGKEVLDQRMFRIATLGSITEEDVDWFLHELQSVCEECAVFRIPVVV